MKTKKRHIAFLLLVILTIAGVVGAAFANSIVLKPANSVELTEIESFGDTAAAKDLVLTMKTRSGSYLYWDTTASFGDSGPTFITRHSYSQTLVNATQRTSIYFYPDLLQIPEILKIVEDIAASAGADEQLTQRTLDLDLYKYAEYVPLCIWAERSSGDLVSGISFDPDKRLDESNSWNKVLDGLNDAVNSFIKVPVPKDAKVHISVNVYRSYAGKADYGVYAWFENWNGMNSAVYRGETVCGGPLIDGAYYVYLMPSFKDAQLSEGPGVYRIPVGDEDLPEIEKAVKVCAFEEGEDLFAESMMSDPKALVLITEKDGRLKEYILSGPDVNTLQVLDLGSHPDPGKHKASDLSFMQVHFYKDCNMLRIPGERWIVVQRAADGSCRMYDFPESEKDLEHDEGQYNYMSAVFDGSRLAVAGPLYEPQPDSPYGATRFSGMRLAVYTEDGLQYYGAWSTSLKENPFIHPPYYEGILDHTLNPSTYDEYWIDQYWN